MTYSVPASAAGAPQALDARFAEADVFCRDEQLLTLERPPLLPEFAAWYLRRFVEQIDGASATPWGARSRPDARAGAVRLRCVGGFRARRLRVSSWRRAMIQTPSASAARTTAAAPARP